MNYPNNLTHDYANILRSIFCTLDDRYNKRKVRNQKVEAKVFGIDPNFTAETFLSAIFLIEDTSQAINNFWEHGLDGPTKYDNVGERYLRLYGLLNSAYMQFVSCRELYKIFKISGFDSFKEQAKQLKILKARNTAAAHSVNFESDGVKDFYKVSQTTVHGFGEHLHIIGERDNEYEINLKAELETFTSFINSQLSKIANELINKLFPQESRVFIELSEELYLNDERAKGSLVFERPDGGYTIASSEINERP